MRYTEQKTNHYIAFTLLAIVRDKVFKSLRRLCPHHLPHMYRNSYRDRNVSFHRQLSPLYGSAGGSGNTGDEIRGQSGELAALVLENIRGLNETIQYGKDNERIELMNSRTDALSQKQSALNKLTGTNIAIANTFRTCLHKKCMRIFEHNFVAE